MRMISEALKLEDLDELNVEIEERIQLVRQMAGTLYPSIVCDEIGLLRMRIGLLKMMKMKMMKK